MADVDYVEGLSGEEIIIDLCTQIAQKLRGDCNLRDADSYMGGYSAEVTINLRAYGIDTAEVSAQVTTGKQQDDPDELINTTLQVPVEPALNVVRERSEQPVPTMSELESGEQVVRPRRYVRREKVTSGGATDEAL